MDKDSPSKDSNEYEEEKKLADESHETEQLTESPEQPRYGPTEKAEVKLEKKRVESDLQKLRNRVKMLQQEQMRAEKKIKNTKTKADKIKKTTEENNRRMEQK